MDILETFGKKKKSNLNSQFYLNTVTIQLPSLIDVLCHVWTVLINTVGNDSCNTNWHAISQLVSISKYEVIKTYIKLLFYCVDGFENDLCRYTEYIYF